MTESRSVATGGWGQEGGIIKGKEETLGWWMCALSRRGDDLMGIFICQN